MMCFSEGESTIPQSCRKRKFEGPDATMMLTDVEDQLARQLKAARREEDFDIDPLSDFTYVQHAIKSLGASKEETLRKVQSMRTFMSKYGVQDTKFDAMKCLRNFFARHPDILLNMDRCGSSQAGLRYFVVLDLAAILQGIEDAAGSGEARATFLGGLFYLSQCLFPHASAMRGGITLIFECGDVDWDQFNDADDIVQLWQDLYCCYPANFRDAWFYNTTDKGTKSLTLLGLRTLSDDAMQRIYLGCKFELEGRATSLKDLYSWYSQDMRAHLCFFKEAERLLFFANIKTKRLLTYDLSLFRRNCKIKYGFTKVRAYYP